MADHGKTRGPVKLGLRSGVGLVVANMIGAGVLTTPGYMAMDLAPAHILWVCALGGFIALCGARAYAALAAALPRSGGEYRYLSEVWHPILGYLAGWTSLIVGFSQPVALDAIAVGAYAGTLFPSIHVQATATLVVLATTALHCFDLRASKVGQNLLVSLKFALFVGFIAVGVVGIAGMADGITTWPTWRPEAARDGLPLAPFFSGLVFMTFCYSGWNAAIYAADEFAAPKRDVPRAMMIGASLVTAIYLLVNWIFVANLTPQHFANWMDGDRDKITLGHVLMLEVLGVKGANVMSLVMIVVLISAASAMMMIGPRVYAAMANDGFLPKVFAGKQGRPPLGALLLQAGVAIFCVWTQSFAGLLGTVGAILTLMGALCALTVFRLSFDARFTHVRPPAIALVAAAIYLLSAVGMLAFTLIHPAFRSVDVPGLGEVPAPQVWFGFIVLVTLSYWLLNRRKPNARRA
jgi:APA family basic amino acid/polyamine antiporter